jgi:hypothetical protein
MPNSLDTENHWEDATESARKNSLGTHIAMSTCAGRRVSSYLIILCKEVCLHFDLIPMARLAATLLCVVCSPTVVFRALPNARKNTYRPVHHKRNSSLVQQPQAPILNMSRFTDPFYCSQHLEQLAITEGLVALYLHQSFIQT